MIDQRLLRSDLPGVLAALARRGRPSLLDEVDEAARLDARVLDISGRRDAIRARVNSISKEVGQLRRDGDVQAAELLQAESRELGDEERALAAEHDQLSATLRELLLGIPNLPHPDAPDGAGDRDNPIVTGPVGLSDDVPDHLRVPHWETATALGILDNERAVKISGAMFTMQRGAGATLARALCQYGLDLNADVHEEVRPPSLVSTATLTATGQLPKFADDALRHRTRRPVVHPHRRGAAHVDLRRRDPRRGTALPIRVMAHSASYRREAGSAGRDTRGMLRAHEFDKVEILAFATPEQAPALLTDMVARAERAIAGLGLAYRIIEICTGDMGQSHHRSFDIEVYAPGADAWLEVSLDQLVQRLPGSPRQHPVQASRRRRQGDQGDRVRSHAQRFGTRGAAGVGGDRRELSQPRWLGHRSRGVAAVHARHRTHRPAVGDEG